MTASWSLDTSPAFAAFKADVAESIERHRHDETTEAKLARWTAQARLINLRVALDTMRKAYSKAVAVRGRSNSRDFSDCLDLTGELAGVIAVLELVVADYERAEVRS